MWVTFSSGGAGVHYPLTVEKSSGFVDTSIESIVGTICARRTNNGRKEKSFCTISALPAAVGAAPGKTVVWEINAMHWI